MALWSGAGVAASFDCKQAKSNMEKAICENTQLSQLDEKLAFEYKAARSKLSLESNQALVKSQRSWLRFTSTYCFIDMDASPASSDDAKNCLVSAFQERVKDLERTGNKIGKFKTYTAIDHHIQIAKEQKTVYTIERKFMQVDDATPSGNRLNEFLKFKDQADLPDGRGTESYDTKLTKISPDWFYKQVSSEMFTGAYPTSETECGLYSISNEKPLRLSDIFKGQAWQKIFETETKTHFIELAKREKDFDMTMIHDFHPRKFKPSSPFTYCLNKNGIELTGFLPHAVRAYDGVTITWKSLESVTTPYAQEQIKNLSSL